jgi:kynurenine formamidase
MRTIVVTVLLAAWGCAAPPPRGIDEARMIDLSHPFDGETVYWPTATRFERVEVAYGKAEGGYWYASYDFCASEHGGTHIDAPIHFAEGRNTVDQIPLAQLAGPARVIDVRDRAAADPDYRLAPEDLDRHERDHGPIAAGSVVLVFTGWGERYPDLATYLGDDKPGVTENLHFPGIGAEAAKVLAARGVDLVGIDTASLDHGPSKDFIAHQILNGANIPGLENVAHLDRVPPTGATVIALPIKIAGGSGGPCRIVALLP